jgi:AAA15 family ATPase/GTPase
MVALHSLAELSSCNREHMAYETENICSMPFFLKRKHVDPCYIAMRIDHVQIYTTTQAKYIIPAKTKFNTES